MYRIEFNAPTTDSGYILRLPTSKSISNRLLLLQYIYPESPEIINLSDSNDTRVLSKALQALISGSRFIEVEDCGTAMRFLIPVLAATPGNYIISGTDRMHERPVADLVDGLRQIGAEIDYMQNEGFPPLNIRGKKLPGGQIIMDGSISSQFISALMMASPLMSGKLEVFLHTGLTSVPYIQMTGELMLQCGIPSGNFDIYMSESLIKKYEIETLIPDKKYSYIAQIKVESDWSAASYIYGIAACGGISDIYIPGLSTNSVQGDAIIPKLYESFGIETIEDASGILLKYNGKICESFQFNGLHQPDIIPALAVTAAVLGIPTVFKGLGNLVFKETNRLDALYEEINALYPGGCCIENQNLRIQTHGITPNITHCVDTRGDHRIAMAFAIAAVRLPIDQSDITVVKKSFPGFWDELYKLGFTAIHID